MRQLAFCVFDRAARAFFPPVFFTTRGLAERWFADMLVDDKTVLAQHPGDFELYEVGEFDASKGVIAPLAEPSMMTTAVQTLSLRQVANG